MIDKFEYHDTSVSQFIQSLNFAYMSHYNSSPINYLAKYANPFVKNTDSLEWNEILENMPDGWLNAVRQLNSVKVLEKTLIHSFTNGVCECTYCNDDLFTIYIREKLDELHKFHLRQKAAFEILVNLQKLCDLPSLQIAVRTLYRRSLIENLADHGKSLINFLVTVKTMLLLLKYSFNLR
jgi:hypothetical protein